MRMFDAFNSDDIATIKTFARQLIDNKDLHLIRSQALQKLVVGLDESEGKMPDGYQRERDKVAEAWIYAVLATLHAKGLLRNEYALKNN